MFFLCSIVMNIICPFRTWPYSCIWLCNIDIFGARTRHIRIMGIVRLGYHGSTETIREAAKNNEESIWERLVQAIEGKRERENTRPPENKKQGKETKNKKNKCDTPQNEKGEKSNTEKRRRKNSATPKEKRKKRREKKRKKKHHSSTPKKKSMKKRKRIRRYLLISVCHSLI